MRKKLYVCISIDVEEEGLFRGGYARENVGLENIALLKRLSPLTCEHGFPLTLFCAWPVLTDKKSQQTLAWMRECCQAEIGAHLHHWSTPPFDGSPATISPRADLVAQNVMEEKLDALLEAAEAFLGHRATSFRMGRWDAKRHLLELLAQRGILVDSSICPLRKFPAGPDHFLAPAMPYRIKFPNGAQILEAPITQLPLSPGLAKIWRKMASPWPRLVDAFHFAGVVSANPVWHSLPVMRMCARLAAKGGVLSLFWHSSELMPGGSPNIPDKDAADALLNKIFSFAAWLRGAFDIEAVTASKLASLPVSASFPTIPPPENGDW